MDANNTDRSAASVRSEETSSASLWPPPSSEVAFVRRTLHASLGHDDSISALLPLDLLVSPDPREDAKADALRALDHESAMLLALLMRDTVLPWYSKLTPDRQLLGEVHRILGRVLRTVTQRFQAHDEPSSSSQLQAFVCTELPLILRNHVKGFREAEERSHSAYLPSSDGASTPVQKLAVCHAASHPHPALAPQGTVLGKISQLYLRTLTESLLVSLLPPEDTAPDTERAIVRDVIVSVLRTVLGRLSRPWFIVQSLNKALDAAGVADWDTEKQKLVRNSRQAEGAKCLDATDALRGQAKTAMFTPNSLVQSFLALLQALFVMMVPHAAALYSGFFDLNFITSSSKSSASRAGHLRSLELEANIPGFDTDVPTGALPDFAEGKGDFDMLGEISVSGLRGRRMARAERQQASETTAMLESRTPGGRPWSVWVAADTESAAEVQADGYPITEGEEEDMGDNSMEGVLAAAADSSRRKRTSMRNMVNGRYPQRTRRMPTHDCLRSEDAKERTFVHAYLTFVVEALLLSRTLMGQAITLLIRLVAAFSSSMVERHIRRSIKSTLRDTPQLAHALRDMRFAAFPDGHLPPSLPDPDDAQQAANWMRLRQRVLYCAPAFVRGLLLSRDPEQQLECVTNILAPFCAPEAAGPNTHLALTLFERIAAVIEPPLLANEEQPVE
ncbi:hypothetical protein K437DRAFT_276736 [Tilletiaria anomala UBC 951]|uniref:PXA domain-containing protein n=1 Tax=Tilletiaria anomala (strain ATCC 24038 / CBS 436.72 / UBC 951) TaxID=1037660 RepID=A0A066VDL5_TILAU|nr:uncharacterized protein K437DRAFT_276736 [Tilletiaria anomala UBC 951]KDN36695.1 hypothetical protein K437DRAFT_276736 [Tilletiaria anomala UBC 951]